MLTKLLYGITALLIAGLLSALAWTSVSLGKAENRAVEATNLAGEYERSLGTAEAAVALLQKEKQTQAKVLGDRAKVAEQQAAKARKERDVLQQALRSNPQWADAPIPDDVVRVLQP